MAGVVMGLFSTLTAMGATVFNQKRDFAGAPVNREAMEAHVRRSKVFLAFIADNYFDSEPCRWEVEEAARVGEPILPVFSGEHHLFAKLLGKFLSMKDDPVKGAAVRACFCQGENLMEVHNPLNVKKVTEDVKAKIVDRFILRPRLVKRHLRGTKVITA